MTAFSAVLTAGVEDYEWLPKNPFHTKVRKPQAPPDRERCLTAPELARLLTTCHHHSNPLLYLAVTLALNTGARKNELLHRQWSEVDLARGLLSIPRSKHGDRRAVVLVPPVVALLQVYAHHATSPWVFPRRDGRQPVFLDYAWRQACAQSGLADFHFHDLRHTAASYLAMSGATLLEIAQILGHRSLRQTMKYTHLAEPHTRAVMQKMAETFLSLPAPIVPRLEEG